MLNLLSYSTRRLIRFVFKKGCDMQLKAPVQVYQTTLYKSTIGAALAAGFVSREQYANFLLTTQDKHIEKGKSFHWCADNVRSAVHWRTTGSKELWKTIHSYRT